MAHRPVLATELADELTRWLDEQLAGFDEDPEYDDPDEAGARETLHALQGHLQEIMSREPQPASSS